MLLSAHGLERVDVYTGPDKLVGSVIRVLFHPSEPTAVGYEVEPTRLWGLLKRKPRYLALDSAVPRNDRVTVEIDVRDAWGGRAAKRLGFDSWDTTVVWRNMPVRTASGSKLGAVKDVLFAPDGPVRTLEITEGVTSDLAIGKREIAGKLVTGFDGEFVRVADEAARVEHDGGAAAIAGRGTAVAADAAGKAAVAAGKAAGKAAAYGKSAAKVAAETETGKKAMDWLKRAGKATVDAMGAPEDDE